ncbi:MAG: type II secretion system protein GspD [Parachlamydiaceae bacterium]|nr:type II secretion system protein GspD [Parachlamydiaceae bacterium]
MKKFISLSFLFVLLHAFGNAQTIAEKKAGLGQHVGSGDLSEEMRNSLSQVNEELETQDKQLRELYKMAFTLFQLNASPCSYKDLLTQIKTVKDKREQIETNWREMATQDQLEAYALWHQPNTTIEQLVIDYGGEDYVYLIPAEIAEMPLSVNSNLPIPRAAWSEMLELILTQSGVGIKQLNPYLRQLYLLKEDNSGLKLITNRRQNLDILPSNERIAFMLSPEPSDVRRVWFFLEKFVNPQSVILQQVGRDILIIGQVSEIQELLKLYDFVSANRGDKDYKVITLRRVDPVEMTKILNTIFGVLSDEVPVEPMRQVGRPQGGPVQPPLPRPRAVDGGSGSADNGLQVIPLAKIANSIFLIGTREEIRKAEKIIYEVEEQVGESRGKTIYWYTTKHSDAEELADVLFRIYMLMVTRQVGINDDIDDHRHYAAGIPPQGMGPQGTQAQDVNIDNHSPINIDNRSPGLFPPIRLPVLKTPYEQGLYGDVGYVVNKIPPQMAPPANMGRDNFIVDVKTGTIVMVVEVDILPKIRELTRKLDVPKKMVQLEVLLFEKRVTSETDFGLTSLRTGSQATNTHSTGSAFNLRLTPDVPVGIFDFFISRTKSSVLPAFDAIYRFLLSQDNVHINASPSVLAINQTPALIEIDEEISVNTGIYNVNTVGGPALENVFARARYGITIEITPSIHIQDGDDFCIEEPQDYVTLATDITFQTFQNNAVNRPDVTTRHIVNEVRIPNGQTVILGGLRQRNTQDSIDKIPFLGEFPGVGKLFSFTTINDKTTEMFIFITPKIIYDPVEDLERIRTIEMCRRPGDIPAFLCCLAAAQECDKQRLFQSTITILLGRRPDRCVTLPGEYDGR